MIRSDSKRIIFQLLRESRLEIDSNKSAVSAVDNFVRQVIRLARIRQSSGEAWTATPPSSASI
jgi:hypothetical protein